MLKAGIALSGANEAIKNQAGDGIITALELSGMDLSHTELVVLSACKTGIGELEDGEGVAGINKAFMKAGAKYIVMALWSVPEKSTGLIMKRFYENLNDGKDKTYSEALRDAKIWMITDIKNSNPHPFYWAGFVGSGRDE
jgi:CHAT domain-containing protein